MIEEGYDIAQICLNGHLITKTAKTNPQFMENFCSICGEKTITECPHCKAFIRGEYHVPGIVSIGFKFTIPKYCYNCGKPYPWTERALKASQELINEIEKLSKEEKEILQKSIEDLIKESSSKEVAVLRFKKYAKKGGQELFNGLKNILFDIVSETIRKQIFGG